MADPNPPTQRKDADNDGRTTHTTPSGKSPASGQGVGQPDAKERSTEHEATTPRQPSSERDQSKD